MKMNKKKCCLLFFENYGFYHRFKLKKFGLKDMQATDIEIVNFIKSMDKTSINELYLFIQKDVFFKEAITMAKSEFEKFKTKKMKAWLNELNIRIV